MPRSTNASRIRTAAARQAPPTTGGSRRPPVTEAGTGELLDMPGAIAYLKTTRATFYR